MATSKKVLKAKQFAKDLHKNHTRLAGENYYEHVLRVHNILKESGVKDENILISALLHQALTFSNETADEIQRLFGEEVLALVTNYKNLSNTKIAHDSKGKFNEKYIVQTYMNMANDLRVLLIRLADKVDNIQTAFALPKKQRKAVAQKALNVYSPITRLLGLMNFTKVLEDGGFKVLYPRQYYKIERAIEEKRPEMERLFSDIKPVLRELLKENGIDAKITTRMKHMYGIHKKIIKYAQNRKIGRNYEGILDIAGMRILVGTEEECYMADNLIRQLWDLVPDEHDDYIQNPKASGYRSIHSTIKASNSTNLEIQIVNHTMYEFNEYGPASHIFYKIGESFKKNLEHDKNWVKKLKQWDVEKNLKKRESRLTQFKDKVYVFTPKGDIMELPVGATALDFAYSVHSKLGHRCVGVVVNEKIQKLNYEIQNGDQIEIKTLSAKKKPSQDWLDIVTTTKARAAIRKALGLQIKHKS